MARHVAVTVGSFDPPTDSPQSGDWPTTSTTGTSGTLTNDANDYFNTAGATYNGMRFTTTTTIQVVADGVTFNNCRFDGHVLVNEVAGASFTDCEFPHSWSVSSSQNVTLTRAKIEDFSPDGSGNGDDSLHVTSDGASLCTDITIEDCYIYNANPGVGAHADGLQVRGSLRLTLRNTYLDLGPAQFEHNAALYLENGPNGTNSDWLVEDCYLRAGYGHTLYISGAGGPGIFRNNTIAPAIGPLGGDSEATDFSGRTADAYMIGPAPGDVTASGNVDENGDPFDVHNPS